MASLAEWKSNPYRELARRECVARAIEEVGDALVASEAFRQAAAPPAAWTAAGAITAISTDAAQQRVVFSDWADPDNRLAFTAEELQGAGTTVCVLESGEEPLAFRPIAGTGAHPIVNLTLETIFELHVPDRLLETVRELELVVKSLVYHAIREAAMSLKSTNGLRWIGEGPVVTQPLARVGDFDDDDQLATRRLQAVAEWRLGPGGDG